jgi:hypothetical protein
VRPVEVHAEVEVLAVMSMASRGAPVMDCEVAELGHTWIKQIRGEI